MKKAIFLLLVLAPLFTFAEDCHVTLSKLPSQISAASSRYFYYDDRMFQVALEKEKLPIEGGKPYLRRLHMIYKPIKGLSLKDLRARRSARREGQDWGRDAFELKKSDVAFITETYSETLDSSVMNIFFGDINDFDSSSLCLSIALKTGHIQIFRTTPQDLSRTKKTNWFDENKKGRWLDSNDPEILRANEFSDLIVR
jgi:hypothetical protein